MQSGRIVQTSASSSVSQGVAQLLPVFDYPNWVVRWFVIAALIGFPFAMLFSWQRPARADV